MKSMKKLLNGESTVSVLDCGDNQFHAALGMEARSRSPLPPSLTTSTSLQDLESHASSSSISLEKKFKPPKPTPLKPPRKHILSKDSNFETYEPIDKYDKIEVRNEAWKTLGIDNVEHTETVMDNDLEEYVSWGRPTVELGKLPITSKIITTPTVTADDDSYDHLNFFGSCNKLNGPKAGYKQVNPPPIVPMASPPSFNDYDVVEPTMESVRIADDSHLGYAIIRKTTRDIDHQFHNDDPYAIISKPKRV